MSDWERYERLVAQLITNQLSTEYCVTPNAQIKGVFSLRNRQIDILIDRRHFTDNRNRIIIDTKIKQRQIDIKDVEAFLGVMEDVQATHGYLVCPNGYTKSAERRAQEKVSLRLLPLNRLENFDPSTWPNCVSRTNCNGKIFWDGYPAIDVTIRSIKHPYEYAIITYILYVGKCDKCRNFHVKCTTCDFIFSVSLGNKNTLGVQCKCQMPWSWHSSIEIDTLGNESAELHLIKGTGIETVSRRSL